MSAHSTLHDVRPVRRRRRGIEIAIIIGFALCLLLGLAAIGALWLLAPDNAAPAVAAPFDLLTPEKVIIGLATRQLAGDPSSALIGQALQAGELPTAAALLLFDTESSASSRTAQWLQLGNAWLAAGDKARAQSAFAQTAAMAAVDVALKPLERGRLLTQAAAGLAAAGANDAAIVAATQALRAIIQTPGLLPAQRGELLEPLLVVVRTLDAPALAATVDDLLRNPYVNPTGVLLDDPWPLLATTPSPDLAVQAAHDARTLAARNLADRYVVTGGIDTEPERQALTAALLTEDQARGGWFREAAAAAATQQQQLGLLEEYRRWLVLKWQVAQRAFGLALVPEWEATLPALEGEIAGVTANILALMNSLAGTQAAPLEQNLLHAESAAWLALLAERGLYPGANRAEINERLRTAQSELERLGAPLALPLALEADSPLPGFHILEAGDR